MNGKCRCVRYESKIYDEINYNSKPDLTMELSPAEIGEKIKNKSDFHQLFA